MRSRGAFMAGSSPLPPQSLLPMCWRRSGQTGRVPPALPSAWRRCSCRADPLRTGWRPRSRTARRRHSPRRRYAPSILRRTTLRRGSWFAPGRNVVRAQRGRRLALEQFAAVGVGELIRFVGVDGAAGPERFHQLVDREPREQQLADLGLALVGRRAADPTRPPHLEPLARVAEAVDPEDQRCAVGGDVLLGGAAEDLL